MGLSIGSQPRIPFSTGLDGSKPVSPLTGDLFYATDTAINYQWTGTAWQTTQNLVPIGGIIPFLKSYTNTPAMPSNFVECNGQVLSDAASVYNGQTIPNLNTVQSFLRGSSTSGTTGGANSININHHHSINGGTGGGGTAGGNSFTDYQLSSTQSILPTYYEVVWIMRVK